MRAVVFDGQKLEPAEVPDPEPGPGEILIDVSACAVCRTDLHIVDGELDKPKLPLVLGHQIVGRVVGRGDRVGVPWLGWAGGGAARGDGGGGRGAGRTPATCRYCRSGRENLCDSARFAGYDIDGGYA